MELITHNIEGCKKSGFQQAGQRQKGQHEEGREAGRQQGGCCWRYACEASPKDSRFGEAANGLALAAALIWAVHPLQTASVTYTIQRAESLMGLLYLLALYCTIRSADSAGRRLWPIAAVVCCALGMACKEVMVTAPVLILLFDRIFLADSFRQVFSRRVGLYVGFAVTWLVLPLLVLGARGTSRIG